MPSRMAFDKVTTMYSPGVLIGNWQEERMLVSCTEKKKENK